MWPDLAGVSLSLLISSLDAGPSSHQPSLTTHQKMSRRPLISVSRSDDSRRHYKEAFSAFDWTNSGRISYGSLKVHWNITRPSFYHQFCFLLKAAMRRCGQNPTDIEVSDIINKIHDDSGSLDLEVTLEFLFFYTCQSNDQQMIGCQYLSGLLQYHGEQKSWYGPRDWL